MQNQPINYQPPIRCTPLVCFRCLDKQGYRFGLNKHEAVVLDAPADCVWRASLCERKTVWCVRCPIFLVSIPSLSQQVIGFRKRNSERRKYRDAPRESVLQLRPEPVRLGARGISLPDRALAQQQRLFHPYLQQKEYAADKNISRIRTQHRSLAQPSRTA
jgi:hypothetical protein